MKRAPSRDRWNRVAERKLRGCYRSTERACVVARGMLARTFLRKTRNEGEERKKEQKEKTRGLWKLTLLMEIRKGRGFPQQLEKAEQKTLGFFTVPTGPTTNQKLILIRHPRAC